jgi:hypothetical protein
MATFCVTLTDIVVRSYFSPTLPLEEVIISTSSGVLTINHFDNRIHYYLQLNSATNVKKLRLGEMVTASGNDPDGRLVALPVPLETVSTGTPAVFRGPAQGGS